MATQYKFRLSDQNCMDLYLFLMDTSTANSEKNRELRGMSPINNAIFHKWLATKEADPVQFIIDHTS